MNQEVCLNVLIVSASEKFNTSLLKLLSRLHFEPISVVTDICSAKRLLIEKSFDIVIINAPLPDEYGSEFALEICCNSGLSVLLLVKSDNYFDVAAKVSPYGVLAISKPTDPQTIAQSLQLLCATRQRLKTIERKAATLEEKMAEIRLINHAKWLLIEQLEMTEAEAHKYIEKNAMNHGRSKGQIAEEIIETYK